MILNVDGEVVGATVQALVQRLTVHEKSSGINKGPPNQQQKKKDSHLPFDKKTLILCGRFFIHLGYFQVL